MSSPIAKSWVHATIMIENEWGGKGTGFLVFREISPDKGRVFLCTNKHVLNSNSGFRDTATKIICHLNVKDANGKIAGKSYELPLLLSDGTKRWKQHPEQDVDVLVFDVTDLINGIPEMDKKWADYSLFADESVLANEEITVGEDVMMVGYPKGFRQGESNLPIVRQGIIASHIGQRYIEDSEDKNGNPVHRSIRGFLVDGGIGIIHGSSGSPVILKPVTGRFVKNGIVMGESKPYLLGILAETRFADIDAPSGPMVSFAGLGMAFDASTVKETIELFFPPAAP